MQMSKRKKESLQVDQGPWNGMHFRSGLGAPPFNSASSLDCPRVQPKWPIGFGVRWLGLGCGDPACGCQGAWPEDQAFATRPPEQSSVENPELETTQQRLVCGSVSTQASLLEGQMSKC